ncbi:TIGR00159 family protein [Paucidesulfovibrio gracilis DSM 16080]|uniref:Diadenylate cyclase n=1 Tax=Paucidesulfovibrio gracilis DSM 16080 TaxID=1121449 RepID=A0A1T4WL02_9BACT|nr:diadenylate cyclase CdaA [Paucidesulfovibrio gracilis]SKA78012.1 TIGR00159 family protein [Paucidesulfovibrio gracilis DSM 16080]
MVELLGLQIAWRDIIDIAIITIVYYQLILLVRGTRAVAVIYGLMLLLVVYWVSDELGLFTLNWLLTNFLGSFFLVIIILFRNDIRKALAQIGVGRFWRRTPVEEQSLNEIVLAVMAMARRRCGALIVMERGVPLGDIMERGIEVDARISKELLMSIFKTDTPLHDGAVVIRNGRVAAAACILPLSSKFRGQTVFGTRHRAALGISEEGDAVSVVVSEETGDVSIAMNGRLTTSLDELRLRRVLKNVLER